MFLRAGRLVLVIYLVVLSQVLGSSIDEYFKKNVKPTASNYGITGLLELPTANFLEEASLRFNFSSSYPNEFTSIVASPFPWLEASYRYVEVKNKKYGPSIYSGNQSYKDKGFDLKMRVYKSNSYLPNMALGLRDIAGTGQFASEYLVGTKKIRNLDITLGLGWGAIGSEATFTSPFSGISKGFSKRTSSQGQGGSFNYADWFSGNASLFGGIEYDLKRYGLRFKVEYDTSNPDKNLLNPLKVNSRINYGINYFLSDSLNLGLSYERGSELRLSIVLTGNFLKDSLKKGNPKNVVLLDRSKKIKAKIDKGIFYRSANKSLRDESIFIQGASYREEEIEVVVASSKHSSYPRQFGRTARIVSALITDDVKKISIHSMNGDLEVASIDINREEFDQADKNMGSSSEILNKSVLYSNSGNPHYKSTLFKPEVDFPEVSWSMSPAIKHQIGGPEAFYLGQLWWKTDVNIKIRRNWSVLASVGVDIYNTFGQFNNPSYSTIPHVRSDIQSYLKEGKNNIQRFKFEYMGSPYKDLFVRFDFGMLEEMFGGVGGEIFYRPFNSKLSLGLMMHKVKQREYRQRFKFRDYKTTTGHLSAHYDFPKGISGAFSVGKYLAKDKGVTLDLSKRFDTGFSLGVFATKTDLSTEEFGEGGFDKGFYFSIPTELFYNDYRTGAITFGLQPLTKDGGARLSLTNSLFSILGDSNKSSILRDWQEVLD